MSELTTPIEINIPGLGTIESADIYLKSEADKVIAELKAQNAQAEDDNALLRRNNAELREANRWRKFPDEKPKWGEEVIVLDKEGDQHIVRFSHDFKWISWGKMNTCESDCIVSWMPLPSAPKEEK